MFGFLGKNTNKNEANIKKNQKKLIKKMKKLVLDDRKPLTKYKNSFQYQIPFDILLDDGKTIFTKYAGFARVVKIRNFDMDYLDFNGKVELFKAFNKMLKNMPDNTYLHYDLIRTKGKFQAPIEREYAPLTTRLCELARYDKFSNMEFYQNDIYITFSYKIPTAKTVAIQDMLLKENPILDLKKSKSKDETAYQEYLKEKLIFEESFKMFESLLDKAVLNFEILENHKLSHYLSYTVNPLDEAKTTKFEDVPDGCHLDGYVCFSAVEDGNNLKIGDYYTKVISENFLPNEITSDTLRRIFNLPFEMRFTTRYIPFTKEEAMSVIKKSEKFHSAKKYNPLQYLFMATSEKNKAEAKENEYEKGLSLESQALIEQLREDNIGWGMITQALILQDTDLQKLNDNVQFVLREFLAADIKATDDKWNAFDAYVGSIPTNLNANIRRLPIHTTAMTYFLPTNSSWHGAEWSKFRNDEPLIKTLSRSGEKFFFDIFEGDVGNTLILGRVGNGKSVLLNSIANYSMKYQGAQIFFFDIDSSSRVLCKTNNGAFYDIGSENNTLSFQPLRRLEKGIDKRFAKEFITALLGQEDEKLITPENGVLITEAIKSLSERPLNERTMSAFVAYVQSPEIKQALQPYTMAGIYGEFFDGNDEKIDNSQIVVFEMGRIKDSPKVINPITMYLSHYIETQRLQSGNLTMVLVDEARTFFMNKFFAPYFEHQLLTSRKKNCHYVFATQSAEHVLESPIKTTIIEQCFTKILTSNSDMTDKLLEIYRLFNLNSTEINMIRIAEPKEEYFIKNRLGSSLFSLHATELDLAFVGAGDKVSQEAIDIIYSASTSLKQTIISWLKYRNDKGKLSNKTLEKAITYIKQAKI